MIERPDAEAAQDIFSKYLTEGLPVHSEDLADQELSLSLFEGTGDARSLDFARQHHATIARFGRFPHRNAALGRTTLPAEAAAVAEGSQW